MGIISIEKADHLFWLGRYMERVYTTLDTFFNYYDQMLDADQGAYHEFCKKLTIPDIYKDKEDFIRTYLFAREDPNSIYSNMVRAFDNAVVLRDELSSMTLSYVQLSLDTIERASKKDWFTYEMQPMRDYLFAFWGCLDDHVDDEECRNIIKCGKYLERLDLYMRLGFPYHMIEKEYNKFLNRLHKIRIGYNLTEVDRLTDVINLGEGWQERKMDALNALWNIF